MANPNQSGSTGAARSERGRAPDSLRRCGARSVLQGRQQLLVHVERANDILNVLALGREFPALKLVLVGASEGWMVAAQITRSGVPVIVSALNDLPGSFEQIAATQSNVGRMRAAGVKVSIGMINDDESHKPFYEREYAGNLVAFKSCRARPASAGARPWR